MKIRVTASDANDAAPPAYNSVTVPSAPAVQPARLLDTNGDGVADSVMVDTNGDGVPDTVLPLGGGSAAPAAETATFSPPPPVAAAAGYPVQEPACQPQNQLQWIFGCICAAVFVVVVILMVVFADDDAGGGSGGCFPGGEVVDLWGGGGAPIELLEPGDRLANGGAVVATMRLSVSDAEDRLYRFDDRVLVTGSHTVLDRSDGRWRHVLGSRLSVPVPVSVRAVGRAAVPTRHIVYNLVTTTHTFSINATTFADWEEVADPDPPQTEADRLAELNHQDGALPSQPWNPRASSSSPAEKTKPVGAIPRTATMEGGFAASTMVSRGGGVPPARIDSLEPGDAIEGGVVMAVIRLPPAAKVWLCGGAGQFPTTVSGYAILRDVADGVWRHAHDTAASCRPAPPPARGTAAAVMPIYQLLTTGHRVHVAGAVWADYEVVPESPANLATSYSGNVATLNANTISARRAPE